LKVQIERYKAKLRKTETYDWEKMKYIIGEIENFLR
jgi:hypothetical protein